MCIVYTAMNALLESMILTVIKFECEVESVSNEEIGRLYIEGCNEKQKCRRQTREN